MSVGKNLPRWQVRITYRTKKGPLDIDHDVEEISEVHDLVEHGPHWDTIIGVYITRQGPASRLTVEEAEEL